MSNIKGVKVALLYQAVQPPIIDGVRKPMKPGGYSDSGADIACALARKGVEVVVPTENPSDQKVLDWVFPDTKEGIEAAILKGATTLWANTILFDEHPISLFAGKGLSLVGQHWSLTQKYDDKWTTNEELKVAGLCVAPSVLISAKQTVGTPEEQGQLKNGTSSSVSNTSLATSDSSSSPLAPHVIPWSSLDPKKLQEVGLVFPLVVKPVRGRGSQGVFRVDDFDGLRSKIEALLQERDLVDDRSIPTYGEDFIVEQFMAGQEVTITIMPPGVYAFGAQGSKTFESHWCLPIVKRFNHVDGIAPYNGTVAVMHNSALLGEQEETQDDRVEKLKKDCVAAAKLVQAKAPIRIDCRAPIVTDQSTGVSKDGPFYLFDLNMKPNMTGPGRPGRDSQDSLCLLSARASSIGWKFEDLLLNMLSQRWTMN